MKRIVYFEIVDIGIREGMGTPIDIFRSRVVGGLFNAFAAGVGTDAESALDDMLNTMQEQGYDVSGLEGQIKEGWEPASTVKFHYHFGIVFRWTQ